LCVKKKHLHHIRPQLVNSMSTGSRNNNFPEFAPGFGADWIDLIEQSHRRSKTHAADCASYSWIGPDWKE
jgi:hypothetical protein